MRILNRGESTRASRLGRIRLSALLDPQAALVTAIGAWCLFGASMASGWGAVQSSPKDELWSAWELEQQGEFERALNAYDQIIADRPERLEVYKYKAGVLLKMGRYSDSVGVMEVFFSGGLVGFQQVDTYVLYAKALMAAGRHEDAESVIDQGLSAHDGSKTRSYSELLTRKALLDINNGKLADAVLKLDASIAINVECASARFLKAIAYKLGGEKSDAAAEMRAALGKGPVFWSNLAKALASSEGALNLTF